MTGELDGYGERSRLRISDAERHQVSELLRQAAGEGRLDMAELEGRLEAAYAARTYADLVPITSDLPFAGQQVHVPSPAAAAPLGLAVRHDTSVAIMSSTSRRGVWEIGSTYNAFALMGGVDLDLRQARFAERETVINAYGFWGGINVYVNERTRVTIDGVGIMGSFDQARDKVEADLGADSPLVRITGLAIMSGVVVQRRPMPSQDKRRRLGR